MKVEDTVEGSDQSWIRFPLHCSLSALASSRKEAGSSGPLRTRDEMQRLKGGRTSRVVEGEHFKVLTPLDGTRTDRWVMVQRIVTVLHSRARKEQREGVG